MSPRHRRYKRRVDLAVFQRLCRFVRWAGPELEARDILRMILRSGQWSTAELGRRADAQERDWAQRGRSPAAELPAAVCGEWENRRAFRLPGRSGRTVIVPLHGRVDYGGTWRRGPSANRIPNLLKGQAPTVDGLRALVGELREVLGLLVNGPRLDAYERITDRLRGQVIVEPYISLIWDPPPRREELREAHRIVGDDFGTYCFLVLLWLVSDGQLDRLGRCPVDRQFFIRLRRGGGRLRHHAFCSDGCRSKHYKMQQAARAARRKGSARS